MLQADLFKVKQLKHALSLYFDNRVRTKKHCSFTYNAAEIIIVI